MNAKRRSTNTATRDPLNGIILFLLFGTILFLAVMMPLFWMVGEKLFITTGSELVEIYKDIIFNSGIRTVGWFSVIPLLTKIDLCSRIISALLLSYYASWTLAKSHITPIKTEVIEQGAEVIKDPDLFLKYAKKKLANADGVYIHPLLRLFSFRECEHIFIAGSTGAGKSQLLSWIIDYILKVKDKMLMFDVKGDYCSQLISPNPEVRRRQKRFLIAPWDDRSIQWNIAQDITNEAEASTFAAAFAPLSGSENNKYFAEAAQDVIEGVLCYFIITKGQQWGWRDLQQTLKKRERILKALIAIDHGALEHIEQESAQTQGVMGSIRAPLKSLDQIARYWPEVGGIPIIKRFINDNTKGVTLIFAARPDQQEIATPLIAGALSLMMTEGLSLADSSKRRCWFVCDELGALPKLSKLLDFVTLARSKGLPMVAGTQDLGRIKTKYGESDAMTIISQFGTQMIGYLNDAETGAWASKIFGQQRTERLQISENQNQAYTGGLAYQPAVSTTWQQSDKGALLDSDFLHLQKATKDGYYFWCKLSDGEGKPLLGKLHFPINPVPKPFPPFIEKTSDSKIYEAPQTMPETPALETAEAVNNKPRKGAPLLPSDAVNTEEQAISKEELDALLEIQMAQEQLLQSEQEESTLETQTAGAALEGTGLDGAGVLLDIAEALTDGGDATSSGSVQQAITKKRKRRKLKSSLITEI